MCPVCKVRPKLANQSKCRTCYNEYMQDYNAYRYEKRRRWAIAHLGGKCSNCGSVENLEFDHIDPSTKSMSIAKVLLAAMAKLIAELTKCQLLCDCCHKLKTKEAREIPHGGGKWGKHSCPCIPCRTRRRESMRAYRTLSR